MAGQAAVSRAACLAVTLISVMSVIVIILYHEIRQRRPLHPSSVVRRWVRRADAG